MGNTQGYTWLDLLAVAGIITVISFCILAVMRPEARLIEERKQVQAQDVNQLTTLLLQYEFFDREGFLQTMGEVEGVRMIGEGSGCADAAAVYCPQDGVQPECLSLKEPAATYGFTLPISDRGEFTEQTTGYLVEKNEEGMRVYSCTKQGNERVQVVIDRK